MNKINFDSNEIKEENKKIRNLRFMVDLSLSLIAMGNLSRDEATKYYTRTRKYAITLFPGKADAFEIIYAPKFRRLIANIYGLN
jgi:hypothetical protein